MANRAWRLLTGLGLGAGLMYFLDPDVGRRRRAKVRDKARHLAKVANETAANSTRDMRNRVRGLITESRRRASEKQVSDDILIDRVRARLGRLVAHPHGVEVSASEGRVTLKGAIRAVEVPALLIALSKVRGVRGLVDCLQTKFEGTEIAKPRVAH